MVGPELHASSAAAATSFQAFHKIPFPTVKVETSRPLLSTLMSHIAPNFFYFYFF